MSVSGKVNYRTGSWLRRLKATIGKTSRTVALWT